MVPVARGDREDVGGEVGGVSSTPVDGGTDGGGTEEEEDDRVPQRIARVW